MVVSSVEPIGVLTKYQIAAVSVEDGPYWVVSDNRVVTSRQEHLIVQDNNGTVINETNLGYEPDKLQVYSPNDDELHILASVRAGDQSPINNVSYCAYYATGTNGLTCRPDEDFIPPSSFVTSMLGEDGSVIPWVIYNDIGGYMIRDLRAATEELFLLPENCACTNHSTCLKIDDEMAKGRVKLVCDGGVSYLYEIYGELSYDLPPNVKAVVTSRNRRLIISVQPAPEGQFPFQDNLFVINMTTDSEYAAFQQLPGVVVASKRNPATIQDLALVTANNSNWTDVVIFIRNNKIFYFEVVNLGRTFSEKKLALHSDLSDFKPVAIKGVYGSSVVILAINSNGGSIHITVTLSGNNASGHLNGTQSTSLPTDPADPTSTTPPGSTETPGPSTTTENKTNCTCTSSDVPVNSPLVNTNECIPYKVSFGIVLALMIFLGTVLLLLMKRIRGSGKSSPTSADD